MLRDRTALNVNNSAMKLGQGLGVLGIALMALMAGLMIAFAGLYGAAGVALLMVIVGGFMLPVSTLMWMLLACATVLAGTIEYFGNGLKQAQWLTYGMAGLLVLRMPLETLRARAMTLGAPPTWWTSAPWLALLLYLLTTVLCNFANHVPVSAWVIFVKNALLLAVVPWALAEIVQRRGLGFLPLIWQCLPGLMLLQLPFVLYQHFVIMPTRQQALSPYDCVVGTFGGDPMGGGSNATLVLFAILAIALSIGRLAHRQGTWRVHLFIIMSALVVIGMGEVKVVVLMLPLALVGYFGLRAVFTLRGLLLLLVGGGLFVAGVVLLYQAIYWSHMAKGYSSLSESLSDSMRYVLDPSNINWRTGEIGRGAALALWWGDSDLDGLHRFLGMGYGSARSDSSVAIGAVALKYLPLNIAPTVLSRLLWEVGYVGTAMFTLVIVTGVLACSRSLKCWAITSTEAESLRLARSFLAICLLLLPYNAYLLDQAVMQALLMVSIATVALLRTPARISSRIGPGHV